MAKNNQKEECPAHKCKPFMILSLISSFFNSKPHQLLNTLLIYKGSIRSNEKPIPTFIFNS